MKVEYGHVKKYFAKKGHVDKCCGYGFVTRTFDNTIRQDNKDRNVFFHISAIEDDFPNLAQQLNNGLGKDVYFWYLIDTSERDKVEKIWLDINDIPDSYQKDLFSYIERLSNQLPPLLEQINNICLATKKHKRQTPVSNRLKLRETDKAKPVEIEAKEVDVHKIEPEKSEIEKAQTDEIIRDENYYAGLPEDLIDSVFWVEREFRRNPLSHKKGYHDIIIEYQDGRILEYDWIKVPSLYMEQVICNLINCSLYEFKFLSVEVIMDISQDYFHRIFARKYHSIKPLKYDYFKEVWNSNTLTTTPDNALRRFEHPILTMAEILEGIKKRKELEKRKREEYRARRYQ